MVTPFAGVWIEISIPLLSNYLARSLPSRECGLKSAASKTTLGGVKSLPSREWGLKYKDIWGE